MSQVTLSDIFDAAADRMRADFQASKAYKHSPEAGKSREGILCEFLSQRVPGHVATAHSAEIIAASGAVSGQCDVVLFDRSTPPILDTNTYRIIPNECVYSVIEVKSSLDKRELLAACEELRRIKSMPKSAYFSAPIWTNYNMHGRSYEYFPTMGLIFAFGGSDIETLGRHLREWSEGRDPWELPDGVYILGRGFLDWINPINGKVDLLPVPNARLGIFSPSPRGDVLFQFMLHLNTGLAQAQMQPLNLNEYAGNQVTGVFVRSLP